MLPIIRCRHALIVAVMLLAAAGSARAQGDPPDRVARLNYITGQVSFRPASLDDWGVATLNYPLTTGDHLWTETGASAEMHVGAAAIRLAPETAFAFLNLENDVVQMRVAEGRLNLRVREIYEGEAYEIDTPNAAISVLRPGSYDVQVDPEGDRTRVTVRDGEVEVDGDGRTFVVYPGQMAEIIGVEDVAYDLGRAPSADRFELWCRDRDRREDSRLALNYVSRDMVGYEDLDDYGSWTYVPEYGYGWQPTVVAVDWAPYRYGHWSYLAPWGWTWVDDSRWGFAPFHYGRWAFYRSRWVWFPGYRSPRPVWAPALVAFVGGHNWNFSFAIGARPAVAWFPLGPGELYCPSYRASARYLRNVNVRNVNITNVNVTNINVTNIRYANRDVAGAMTAVPRDMFVGSQPVQRIGTAVPRATAQQASVVGHAVAVSPDRTSVIGRVPANAAQPPASVMRRTVVARSEPPASVTTSAPVVNLRRPMRGGDRARPAESASTPDTRANSANDEIRTPAARPRNDGAAATDRAWRPDGGSRVVVPSEQPDASRTNTNQRVRPRTDASGDQAPIYRVPSRTNDTPQRPADSPSRSNDNVRPRNEAPGYRSPAAEAPVYRAPQTETPRYQAPQVESPRYEAPRVRPRSEDRQADAPSRVAPREERQPVQAAPGLRPDSAGTPSTRETQPERSVRPRSEDRGQDRPATPARVERPAAQPDQPSRAGERAQPKSGGQAEQKSDGKGDQKSGGQSNQNARPRGGRGGQ